MKLIRHRRSLVVAACCFLPAVGYAQGSSTTRPSPAEAQTLLQSRPDLVAQLRQRLVTSGMTREQVHARLRAEGYPEDILDPYLSGNSGGLAVPSDSIFAAVRLLGVASDSELVQLRRASFAPPAKGDLVRDTIERVRRDTAGFEIFGLDLFRNATTQFDANLSGPVDANYQLGPLDRLVLILTGDVEASYSLEVTREGFVVIPQVGQVYVNNLTLGQLESVLSTRLSRLYSGIRANGQGTTRFSVSVARLRSNQVYVTGEARKGGSYQVSSAGTALSALYAAGGPTVSGSLRAITVLRSGRVVDTLDVYNYLVRGDASHDPRLQNGDVVFIPVHGPRARILGEVVRSATYELTRTESLADLLRFAGGLRATADQRHVIIERILAPANRTVVGRDRITLDVPARAFTESGAGGFKMEDGDVVHVLPVSERVADRIFVTGNVRQPGIHALAAGMHLSDALRTAGGVQPDSYLGEVLISRLRSDSSRVQLRAMLADTLNHVIDDPMLQEDDSISVFSLTTFRPARYVVIGGSVNTGGRYPYREGMTLRDLVLTANGLTESALLSDAEVARLPQDRTGGITAQTISVPLDSTYVFERDRDGKYLGPPGLAAAAAGAPDFLLRPYDAVLIKRQPNWELQRTVTIQGEVRHPGVYALVKKSERLSDIISRAGGLTDEAYPEATVFSRAQYGVGRVGVDVPTALRSYESADNLILRDGDTVNVRQYLSLVVVRGQVNAPTAVAYLPGKGIDYYINAAGGPTRTGDEDRAYVQQPNGKYEAVKTHFLRPAAMPRPRPGAVVTVPELNPADKKDFQTIAAQIGQIVAGLATILILAKR